MFTIRDTSDGPKVYSPNEGIPLANFLKGILEDVLLGEHPFPEDGPRTSFISFLKTVKRLEFTRFAGGGVRVFERLF